MDTLDVSDLYVTVQGEGSFTGKPLVLLRLQGCDVGCPWCDTAYTWARDAKNEQDSIPDALGDNEKWVAADVRIIADFVMSIKPPGVEWVLLTGGEPAQQPLGPLLAALHMRGLKVQLETSGTGKEKLGHVDWVTLSPKVGMPGGVSMKLHAINSASEIKWVVGKDDDVAKFKDFLEQWQIPPDVPKWVQPLSQSEKATELCIRAAAEYGWSVSLQTHKLLGLK